MGMDIHYLTRVCSLIIYTAGNEETIRGTVKKFLASVLWESPRAEYVFISQYNLPMQIYACRELL